MCQEEIMNKRFTACLTTLILSVFFSISASADVVKVDGIYYDISGTTATVTQVGDYSGDIVIPESITFEITSNPPNRTIWFVDAQLWFADAAFCISKPHHLLKIASISTLFA